MARTSEAKLDEILEMAAAGAVNELWGRLMTSALHEYQSLYRQGLPTAEIARRVHALLDSLSTKPDALIARGAATVAYGEGRAAAIVSAKRQGGARFALRSAILDESACSACVNLDGTVVEIGSPDFAEVKPPARCDGRERCRCVYIALGPALFGRA